MIFGNISTHFEWFPELHHVKETLERSLEKKKKNSVFLLQALKGVNDWTNLLIATISHNLIQAAIKHHQWLEGSYFFEPSLASHAIIQTEVL